MFLYGTLDVLLVPMLCIACMENSNEIREFVTCKVESLRANEESPSAASSVAGAPNANASPQGASAGENALANGIALDASAVILADVLFSFGAIVGNSGQ